MNSSFSRKSGRKNLYKTKVTSGSSSFSSRTTSRGNGIEKLKQRYLSEIIIGCSKDNRIQKAIKDVVEQGLDVQEILGKWIEEMKTDPGLNKAIKDALKAKDWPLGDARAIRDFGYQLMVRIISLLSNNSGWFDVNRAQAEKMLQPNTITRDMIEGLVQDGVSTMEGLTEADIEAAGFRKLGGAGEAQSIFMDQRKLQGMRRNKIDNIVKPPDITKQKLSPEQEINRAHVTDPLGITGKSIDRIAKAMAEALSENETRVGQENESQEGKEEFGSADEASEILGLNVAKEKQKSRQVNEPEQAESPIHSQASEVYGFGGEKSPEMGVGSEEDSSDDIATGMDSGAAPELGIVGF